MAGRAGRASVLGERASAGRSRVCGAARAALLLVLGGAPLSPAFAQARDASVLDGRTLDHRSEAPVVAARIQLVDVQGRTLASAVADAEGRFRFGSVPPGVYTIRASSLGHRDVRTPEMRLAAGDTADVIVWMDVEAVPLTPLEIVVGRPPEHRNPGLQGLYARSRSGLGGAFILADEIERRSPTRVTDVLTTTGSIEVSQGGLINRRWNCAPAVYLDGVRIFDQSSGRAEGSPPVAAYRAVNMVSPLDVEGIEVYRGAATVPAEFGGPTAACGVIVIWTRRS